MMKDNQIKSKDDIIHSLQKQVLQKEGDITRMKVELDQLKQQLLNSKAMKGMMSNDAEKHLSAIKDKLKSYEIQKNQLDERNQVLELQLKRLTVEGVKCKSQVAAIDPDLEYYVNYKK